MNRKEMIKNYITSKRDEMIADLAELIRIPSVMSEPSRDMRFVDRKLSKPLLLFGLVLT